MTPYAFDGEPEPASLRLVHDVGAWVRDLERRARETADAAGDEALARAEAAERRVKHADAATRAAIQRVQHAEARMASLTEELRAASQRADKAEAWLKIAHACLRSMATQRSDVSDEPTSSRLVREGLVSRGLE